MLSAVTQGMVSRDACHPDDASGFSLLALTFHPLILLEHRIPVHQRARTILPILQDSLPRRGALGIF